LASRLSRSFLVLLEQAHDGGDRLGIETFPFGLSHDVTDILGNAGLLFIAR
jgi:hypothetical protein